MTVAELFVNSTIADDPLSLILSGPLDYSARENMFDSYSAVRMRGVPLRACDSWEAMRA